MDTTVVADKISYLKTGANFIRRTTKKAKGVLSVVRDVGILTGVVIGGVWGVKTVYDNNKEKVVELLSAFTHK